MKLTEEQKNKLKELYEKGMSMNAIAKVIGCSVVTVRNWLNKWNYKIRHKAVYIINRREAVFSYITQKLDDFVNNNITAKQMAQEYGIHELTMRQYLKKYFNASKLAEAKRNYKKMVSINRGGVNGSM